MLVSFEKYSFLIKALVWGCIIAGIFFTGMIMYVLNHTIVDFSPLTTYQTAQPSILLDDEGNEWGRFQLDRREAVRLDQMPPHLIYAFLAAEDWQFFSHVGISLRGIVRSTCVNLYNRRKVQGASTITQQLVKLLFFDSQKTYRRKIKEQLYAILVEQQCTKEQILQTYLNHIYFGCGIYGVEAASQRFWGISATDITIDQAAILASIVRSPGHYSPLINPALSIKRRNLVLRSMHRLRYISDEQYEHALQQPITIVDHAREINAPHAKEMIRQYLEELVGRHELYCGGLTIATTLNKDLQQRAQQAFIENIAKQRDQFKLPVDGALLSVEHETGQIKALVGGFDFSQSKFNRVNQARRQLGSIIKPLVYAVAIQKGKTFADTYVDEPMQFNDNGRLWSPNNHYKDFMGQMTLAYALSHSSNIVTIKTLLDVGAQPIANLAKRAHISQDAPPYPSLALGCVDVTLQEAVGMFALFPNNGTYIQPHLIRWVKDRWGSKIMIHNPSREKIIESRVAGAVGKVLNLGIDRVRRQMNDQIVDAQVMSKTGTTNDSRTCWFIGSTPTLTTGIYVGCDDNSSLGKNIFPIITAFPIWRDLYRGMKTSKKEFTFDPNLKEIWIDEKTGLPSVPARAGAISILI